MYLEKQNEIVWSVKRKNHMGKFEFRATQQGNSIVGVSVSLLEGDKDEKRVTFQMNYSEFQNFYKIVSNFRDLVESPHKIAKNAGNIQQVERTRPVKLDEITNAINNLGSKVSPSLSLDGNKLESYVEESQVNLADLEEDLAILNSLEESFTTKSVHEPEIPSVIVPETSPSQSGSNNKSETKGDSDLQRILDDIDSNNSKKLKETDWDPW